MKSSIVSCRKLTKLYREGEIETRALSEIDLDLEPGAFVSLCGPSGSGKTTLLNMIGGLDRPSSGEITVAGQRIDQMSNSELAELRLKKVGFIFQAYNLLPVLSAQENVEFVMQLQGIERSERVQRARDMLNAVGLAGLEHRRPGELSGGQQQRVAVARAIVSNPSLVLADEPTANLDSKTAHGLLELMRQMNSERGVTFVFSTHDKQVMEFARRLILLQDGRIVNEVVQS